jgi:hypothetical protein
MALIQDFLAAVFLFSLGICALGMWLTGQLPPTEVS